MPKPAREHASAPRNLGLQLASRYVRVDGEWKRSQPLGQSQISDWKPSCRENLPGALDWNRFRQLHRRVLPRFSDRRKSNARRKTRHQNRNPFSLVLAGEGHTTIGELAGDGEW